MEVVWGGGVWDVVVSSHHVSRHPPICPGPRAKLGPMPENKNEDRWLWPNSLPGKQGFYITAGLCQCLCWFAMDPICNRIRPLLLLAIVTWDDWSFAFMIMYHSVAVYTTYLFIGSQLYRYEYWVCGSFGALDGGSPLSHVDFKKLQCPCCLFSLMSHVKFKKRLCHIFHYNFYPLSHVTKPYVACRI